MEYIFLSKEIPSKPTGQSIPQQKYTPKSKALYRIKNFINRNVFNPISGSQPQLYRTYSRERSTKINTYVDVIRDVPSLTQKQLWDHILTLLH